MNAVVENLLDHVRGAWRYRWKALIVAWIVCIVGWAVVISMPNTYEASARVFVDSRTALSEVTQGIAVETSVEAQIARVREALFGGPALEKVAQEVDLDVAAVTPQERQAVIAGLRNRINIAGATGRNGTYVLSYKDNDRERAVRVVDRLLNNFMESTLGGKRAGSENAQRFLVDQIADYERRLSAAEERLAEFKKQNVGLMPGAQGDYFSRLQTEMDGLNQAQSALASATRKRDGLQRQLRGGQPFVSGAVPGVTSGTAGGTTTTSETAARIRETQSKLDELMLRFTDRHPDVMALRETLAELRERERLEIEAVRSGDASAAARAGFSSNPVFQTIQLQLNEAEVELATLRGEIADRQRKVAELRKLLDTAPEVEAELARLNRDYDVTRAQYQTLLERLERARLGEQAEERGIIYFEVIDPPAAPYAPVSPNRPLLIAVVLLAGLAAGAGVAVLLHQLNPVFNTSRQLTEALKLPVLGVVSMTWLDKYQAAQRRNAIAYAGATALLLVASGVVLLLHGRATQIVQRLLT